MTVPVRQPATYEDLLAVPANMVGEMIASELIVMPRPRPRHAAAASSLGEELGPPFRRGRGGPGGWIFLDEPELHLGDDVVVPDLAAWHRARLPELPDVAYLDVAPDWVCEVLSPATARVDRVLKRRIYSRERVRHCWLVDPDARTLEVERLDGETYRIVLSAADADRVRAEPFEAIELDLALLWAP